MLHGDGSPRLDLYLEDQLHLSEAGYRVWARRLREASNYCPSQELADRLSHATFLRRMEKQITRADDTIALFWRSWHSAAGISTWVVRYDLTTSAPDFWNLLDGY